MGSRNFSELESPLLVMKFGGTSVGDARCIERVLEIIASSAGENSLAVVVSAMAGVTDRLIEAAERSAMRDGAVAGIFKDLRGKHESAADELIHLPANRGCYGRIMEKCFAEGERACEEITRASQLTPETRDLISSLGERLCAPLVAAALGERGIESEAIDARDCLVTDARHGAANPALELTRQRCESRLRPLLKQGIVPVLTGFLGATPQGTLTTLGRGGSDYSASLMGAALDAHEVIIWTDVDGFLTSDPRLVPEACTIPQISYRQAAALAYFGARVLHPRTLQPVIQRGIPVWIRNTFAPEKEGTKITLDGAPHDSAVKALAVISDVSLIIMGVSGVEVAASVLHRAFAAVTAAHGDVLLTSHTHSPRELCFVVRSAVAKKTMDALRKEFTCEGYTPSACDILLRNGMALVTVVGQHLRELSGIARQAFEALEREELRVVASSQGASDCNISFVVARDEMQEIVDVLHKEFHLEKPGEAY